MSQADQLEGAELALREAEQLFEAGWPPSLRAEFLVARGRLCQREGRFEAGLVAWEELLRLATALGDKRMTLRALIFLEGTDAALGRLEKSVALGRDMLNLMRQDHSLRSGFENIVMSNLAMALTRLDRIDEALEMARDAYPSVERAGRVMELLDPYALLAFKRGRVDDAARMIGRAVLRFATSDVRRFEVEQRVFEELMAKLRDTLPSDELARLMKEGEALSDEEAARLALRG